MLNIFILRKPFTSRMNLAMNLNLKGIAVCPQLPLCKFLGLIKMKIKRLITDRWVARCGARELRKGRGWQRLRNSCTSLYIRRSRVNYKSVWENIWTRKITSECEAELNTIMKAFECGTTHSYHCPDTIVLPLQDPKGYTHVCSVSGKGYCRVRLYALSF